jgi:hypothetical protein
MTGWSFRKERLQDSTTTPSSMPLMWGWLQFSSQAELRGVGMDRSRSCAPIVFLDPFGGIGDIFRAMESMRSLVLLDQPDLSGVKERDSKRVSMSHSSGLKERTRRRIPSMAQRIAMCHYRRG